MELLSQPAFGQLLRRLRTERGLSQADLVGPGVSASYVSRLESGARAVTAQAATHLAERMGVPLSVFEGGTKSRRAAVLFASGITALDDGKLDEAVRELTAAAAAAPGEGPDFTWQVLWHLAKAHARVGDKRAQRECLARLRPLVAELGISTLEVHVLAGIAGCDRTLGDVDSAVSAARQALAIAEDTSASDRVEALLALVAAETEAGRLNEAADHTVRLLAEAEGTSGGQRVRALWTASMVHGRRGSEETSLTLLEEALSSADAQNDLLTWARLRLAAVSLHLRVHRSVTAAAEQWCQEAETALGMIGMPQHLVELRALQARIAFHRGDFEGCAELCRQVLAEPGSLSYHDRVRTEVLLHQAEASAGSIDAAAAELRRIAEDVTRSGNLDLAAEAWKALAEGLVRSN
jgi:transcriptional regulator with XRE-family HTH domain